MLTDCSSVTGLSWKQEATEIRISAVLKSAIAGTYQLPIAKIHKGFHDFPVLAMWGVETYAEFLCKVSHHLKCLLWVIDERVLCCSIIQGSWNPLFPFPLFASFFVCPKMKKVKIVK